MTILDISERLIGWILQLSVIAPTPSSFECGSLSPEVSNYCCLFSFSMYVQQTRSNATSYRANCIRVFMRLKVLATTCQFFRNSVWEDFIGLVGHLSKKTDWTYLERPEEPFACCSVTAAVQIAILKWNRLMDAWWDYLQEVEQFFENRKKDALLNEQGETIKKQGETIKKQGEMIKKQGEMIKSLQRSLGLAFEQSPSGKRRRVAD
jgi:hypothetical protein